MQTHMPTIWFVRLCHQYRYRKYLQVYYIFETLVFKIQLYYEIDLPYNSELRRQLCARWYKIDSRLLDWDLFPWIASTNYDKLAIGITCRLRQNYIVERTRRI